MGKEGNKIDGFVAHLSRDVAACKLEKFRWTDYQILLCINTLLTNDKDEARLAEKLTKMYNAHCKANTSMTLASVQTEVKKFWGAGRKRRSSCTAVPPSPGRKTTLEETENEGKERKQKRSQAAAT